MMKASKIYDNEGMPFYVWNSAKYYIGWNHTSTWADQNSDYKNIIKPKKKTREK